VLAAFGDSGTRPFARVHDGEGHFSTFQGDMAPKSTSGSNLFDVERQHEGAVILVIDDDSEMRSGVKNIVRYHGIRVIEAGTGNEAIVAAEHSRLDLALVDFRLPDMTGLDVISALKRKGIDFPWVLMSGAMTVALAVQATRVGALNAVSLPCDVEAVVLSALELAANQVMWPRIPLTPRLPLPRSSAERWAWFVLRACDSTHDLHTILAWSLFVGMSYRSLTENCRLVGVTSHHSRDFMRILRVLLQHGGRSENLELSLIVNDYRTLMNLFRQAGFDSPHPSKTLTISQFLNQQRFIQSKEEVLSVLKAMLAAL
jgi:CheY-like chemotaxis protein